MAEEEVKRLEKTVNKIAKMQQAAIKTAKELEKEKEPTTPKKKE